MMRHLAELVPRRMLRWRLLRRWYWQPEELAAARARARERAREIGWYVD
jgi:hypothetical protein